MKKIKKSNILEKNFSQEEVNEVIKDIFIMYEISMKEAHIGEKVREHIRYNVIKKLIIKAEP